MCTWTRFVFKRIKSYVHNVNLVKDDLSEWVLIALSIYLPFTCRKLGQIFHSQFTQRTHKCKVNNRNWDLLVWQNELCFFGHHVEKNTVRPQLMVMYCGYWSFHQIDKAHIHIHTGSRHLLLKPKSNVEKIERWKSICTTHSCVEWTCINVNNVLEFWHHHDQKQWFPIEKFFCFFLLRITKRNKRNIIWMVPLQEPWAFSAVKIFLHRRNVICM